MRARVHKKPMEAQLGRDFPTSADSVEVWFSAKNSPKTPFRKEEEFMTCIRCDGMTIYENFMTIAGFFGMEMHLLWGDY